MPPSSSPDDDVELLPTILYLIQRGYWVACYELYVDATRTKRLDEASKATLKSFFTDANRFPPDVLACVRETFDSGVSAARIVDAESRAALAEYDLRCAREDLKRTKAATTAGGDGDIDDDGVTREEIERALNDEDIAFGVAPSISTSTIEVEENDNKTNVGVDLDAKLDAAAYEYLTRRGYKATALSMRDESVVAAKISVSGDDQPGRSREFGALRRMYERARMTETTADALESERARLEEAESELIRARARIDELEKENTSLLSAHETASTRLTRVETELVELKETSATWEEKATRASSEVNRLLSELGSTSNERTMTWSGNGAASDEFAPRTTIEENETIDACLALARDVSPQMPLQNRLVLLPLISRACERACGNDDRANAAASLFFEIYSAPNDELRDGIASAILGVGEKIGSKLFDETFTTRGCLSADGIAAMRGAQRVLALHTLAEIGISSWYDSKETIVAAFERAAADPSDEVRIACSRAAARYVTAKAPSEDVGAELETVLMTLAHDGSDEVAEESRAVLALAIAESHLQHRVDRFTGNFAQGFFDAALEALQSGWSGEGRERKFVGWSSPEEGDTHRWRAIAMMKSLEAMMPTVRRALESSKPADVESVESSLADAANTTSWPLARWCVGEASDLVVRVISSAAPDVIGQESVREGICAAAASWCAVLGPRATREVLIGKLNEACQVSFDQRAAVLPILLAGVVPYTPNGDAVLGDYLRRLIVQADLASSSEIVDAARYLAAFERHTESLLRTLKQCCHASADNPATVRLLAARLLAATSEVLPLQRVIDDVYPALNVLRNDPEPDVRCDAAMALAAVACVHYETVDPTAQTMRQLEALTADPEIDVRIAVIAALARGATVPGTSFAVSSAGAVSALAQHVASSHSQSDAHRVVIADALFRATRDMLGNDGNLFPQLSSGLYALIGGADPASDPGVLDQASRAQCETMLRDGGWAIDNPDPAHPPSSTNHDNENPSSTVVVNDRGGVYDRMKSKARALGGRVSRR